MPALQPAEIQEAVVEGEGEAQLLEKE